MEEINKKESKTFFYQPSDKRKWWQIRKMDRKEYGYTALLGLLAGCILRGNILGEIFRMVWVICGIIWLIKTIRHKTKK